MVEIRSSSEIPVKFFRQIFHWPLILSSSQTSGKSSRQRIRHICETLDHGSSEGGGWQPVPKPLGYPVDAADGFDDSGYAEFTYFHDFVREFLYPTGDEGAFKLFERKDITALHAEIGDYEHVFKVDRLSLHLIDSGVAIMTLELTWQRATHADLTRKPVTLTLAETQRIIDYLRRSHAPFWLNESEPARSPKRVKLEADGVLESFPPQKQTASRERIEKHGQSPSPFPHWEALIHPLALAQDGGDWRDPSDERLPTLSYISLTEKDVPDAEAILRVSEADWARLADAEEPSSDGLHPYNPDFSQRFLDKASYDRFMPTLDYHKHATRYLFGGPHFATIGAGWFFDNYVRTHFRRHYAQLAFIARFEMATLLETSSRITSAVARRDRAIESASTRFGTAGARKDFQNDILTLQDDFLTFTHQFHFTGVSSQAQPADMHQKWRESLDLDALYADVKTELESAAALVRAGQQKAAADASERLAVFATVGVMLGLIVGALGMNVLVGTDKYLADTFAWSGLRQFGAVTAGVGALSFILALFLRSGLKITLATLFIGAMGLYFAWLYPSDAPQIAPPTIPKVNAASPLPAAQKPMPSCQENQPNSDQNTSSKTLKKSDSPLEPNQPTDIK